jgi:hypothetical protein
VSEPLTKMRDALAAGGYVYVDGFHVVEPGDWGEERGAAFGRGGEGRGAIVEWVDNTTCPSCSGGYDVEGPEVCRYEADAKARFWRLAGCR